MKINHDIWSISLVSGAILLGLIMTLMSSLLGGVLYLSVIIVSFYLILMNYCRKCPHSMNNSCKHIVPGRLAKKLPYKKTAKYTIVELIIVIISIAVVFLLPIIYIYDTRVIMFFYFLLWGSGIFMLRKRVCISCLNRRCALCPNRVKQ